MGDNNKEVIWTFTPDPKSVPSSSHGNNHNVVSNSSNHNTNQRDNQHHHHYRNNNHHDQYLSSRKRSRSSNHYDNNNSNYYTAPSVPYQGHPIVQAGKGSSYPPPPPPNQPFRSSRYNYGNNNNNNNNSRSYSSSSSKKNNNNHRSFQSSSIRINGGRHEIFMDNSSRTTNSSGSSKNTALQQHHQRQRSVPWRHARTLARDLYLAVQSFENNQEDDQNELEDELILNGTDPSLLSNLPKVPKHSNPILQHYTGGYSSLPIKCALLRLHEEILDFAAFVTPSPNEQLIANKALNRINTAIMQNFPNAKIEIFGSRVSNLVLPTSDWDIALFGVAGSSPNMYKLAREMEKNGLVSRTEVITTARVPIVKLWEKQSGIQIDISFEAKSALVSRSIIQTYLVRYPVVRPLVLVLKYYLLQRGLNDTFTGGVGSFLLVLMVVHVVSLKLQEFQQLNSPRTATNATSSSAASINLGMLLVSIFEYYGFNLNTKEIGISVLSSLHTSNLSSPSSSSSSSSSSSAVPSLESVYYTKRSRNWYDIGRDYLLSIENPSDTLIDAGKNSWGMERIQRSFRITHVNLARVIRQYDKTFNNYVATTNQLNHQHHQQANNNNPTVPESILTSVIRIDTLLRERAIELFEQQNTTLSNNKDKATEDNASGSENDNDDTDSFSSGEIEELTEQPAKVAKTAENSTVTPSSVSHPTLSDAIDQTTVSTSSVAEKIVSITNPVSVSTTEVLSRKVQNELETQAKSSGIVLRHSRLLADIMTRKERGVEALALQAPQYGTY